MSATREIYRRVVLTSRFTRLRLVTACHVTFMSLLRILHRPPVYNACLRSSRHYASSSKPVEAAAVATKPAIGAGTAESDGRSRRLHPSVLRKRPNDMIICRRTKIFMSRRDRARRSQLAERPATGPREAGQRVPCVAVDAPAAEGVARRWAGRESGEGEAQKAE